MANIVNKSSLTNNVASNKAADINYKAIQDLTVNSDAINYQINTINDKAQDTKIPDPDGVLTSNGDDQPDIDASPPPAVPQPPLEQADQPNQDAAESSNDQESAILRQETSIYQPDYGTIGFESNSPIGKYFSPLAPDGLDNVGLYENFKPLDPFPFKNVTFADQIIHDQHINQTPPNLLSPPVANPDSYTVTGSSDFHVNAASGVLANDTDNNPAATSLQASLVSGPSHGTVKLNSDGSFDYTNTSGYKGEDKFTYKDTNSDGTSNITTVTLNDQQPALQADSYQVNVNQDSSINIDTRSDNDPTGTIPMIIQQPTHGTVTYDPVSKVFDYTPNSGFSGLDGFTYQKIDGTTDSNPGKVYINVNPVEYLISGFDESSGPTYNTSLFSFNPETGQVTIIGQSNIVYNALGDDPVDNTLYAINTRDNHLVKVNELDGSTTDVGPIINSEYNNPGPIPNSGTFDAKGLYYEGASQSAIVQINGISEPMQVGFSTQPVGSDTAINKDTNNLFTILPESDNFEHILTYSIANNMLTFVKDQPTSLVVNNNGDVGGLLIDGSGNNLYGVLNNNSGVPLSIVKFNISDGTATVVGTINIAGAAGIDATSVTHPQSVQDVTAISTPDPTTTVG